RIDRRGTAAAHFLPSLLSCQRSLSCAPRPIHCHPGRDSTRRHICLGFAPGEPIDAPVMLNQTFATRTWLRLSLHRQAHIAPLVLSWLVPLVFLAWAARLVLVEGYLYPLENGFSGDFTRTAALGAPQWWTGQGIFYGPLFVLEFRYLLQPDVLSGADFARFDFVLFGLAFVCAWRALFGVTRIRLAVLVLALWLVHHASVEAFSNTAHLEVLELTFMCAGLWLAVRGNSGLAGVGLGLAAATKTL